MQDLQLSIKTQLYAKDEVFRIIALGHRTGLPVLLIGPPGVAKTQVSIDYAASFGGKVFTTQFNMGTRPSSILGVLDIPALVHKGEQRTISPIAEADLIHIDEVDKGSQEVRNMLLSIMRERKLMLGAEGERACNWKVFVGTCNGIPMDEITDPFWDRFVIKYSVDRVGIDDFGEIWKCNERTLLLNVASVDHVPEDISKKLATFLYPSTTDRTLSYIPNLIAAVKGIWNLDDVSATVKVAHLIAPGQADRFISSMIQKEYVDARAYIQNALKLQDAETAAQALSNAEKLILKVKDAGQRSELVGMFQHAKSQLVSKLGVTLNNA